MVKFVFTTVGQFCKRLLQKHETVPLTHVKVVALILSIYYQSVMMHVKFHESAISCRGVIALWSPKYQWILSIQSHNLVTNGWNFMRLTVIIYLAAIYWCISKFVIVVSDIQELLPFDCLNFKEWISWQGIYQISWNLTWYGVGWCTWSFWRMSLDMQWLLL